VLRNVHPISHSELSEVESSGRLHRIIMYKLNIEHMFNLMPYQSSLKHFTASKIVQGCKETCLPGRMYANSPGGVCRCRPIAQQGLPDAVGAISVEEEVANTLKIVALINRFRSRGHLVAQLDPLKRGRGLGPWMADAGVNTPW
jgi:2-oxoglutarate dehydrogenase complex dehydrogenase (E1) component-like enzyme